MKIHTVEETIVKVLLPMYAMLAWHVLNIDLQMFKEYIYFDFIPLAMRKSWRVGGQQWFFARQITEIPHRLQ